MPRPATQKHPVRDLRKIIKKYQIAFAKSIGISPGGLKRIENNDMDLSRRIALRIFAETGANAEKLLAGKLRAENGEKYTVEFYEKWKKRWFNQSEAIAIDTAKGLAGWIEILFRASVVGSRQRLWQVWRTLADAIDDCAGDFDLRAPIETILAKEKPRVKWNLAQRSPSQLREILREQQEEEASTSRP
jgi:hypothetical protein